MNDQFFPYFVIVCGILGFLVTNSAAKSRAKIYVSFKKGKVEFNEALKMFRILFYTLSGFTIIIGLLLILK